MDWKLFWKVVRIGFGAVIFITAIVMLCYSLFAFESIDIAYCMFSVLTMILSIIMVVFGVASLPKKSA